MTSRSRRHVTAIRPASTATTNHQLTIWNNRQSLGLSPVFRTRPTQEEFELRIYGRNSNLRASLIIGGHGCVPDHRRRLGNGESRSFLPCASVSTFGHCNEAPMPEPPPRRGLHDVSPSQAVSCFRITSRCSHADAAETWFEENDPEGVAFEYEVLE